MKIDWRIEKTSDIPSKYQLIIVVMEGDKVLKYDVAPLEDFINQSNEEKND